MKFRTWLAVVICAVVFANVLSDPQTGLAEDDLFGESVPREQEPRRVRKVERVEARTVVPTVNAPWGQPDSRNEIEQAAKALHDAKDDEAKEKAERKLTELLDKYFEEDMKRREDELANVEQRVKSLRELLAKRQSKRAEIIELQIKVLENEAEGLGFFSNSPQARGGYGSLFLPGAPGGMGQRWNINPPSTPATIAPGASGGAFGSGSGFMFSDGNSTLHVTGTTSPPAEPPAPPRTPRPPRATRPAEQAPPAESAAPAEAAEPLFDPAAPK